MRPGAGPCVIKGDTQEKPGLETSLLDERILVYLFPSHPCVEVSKGAFATFMHSLLKNILRSLNMIVTKTILLSHT